jgi:hypothetical protein
LRLRRRQGVIALDKAKKHEYGQGSTEDNTFIHNGKELYMIRLILVESNKWGISFFSTNVESESPVTRIFKL